MSKLSFKENASFEYNKKLMFLNYFNLLDFYHILNFRDLTDCKSVFGKDVQRFFELKVNAGFDVMKIFYFKEYPNDIDIDAEKFLEVYDKHIEEVNKIEKSIKCPPKNSEGKNLDLDQNQENINIEEQLNDEKNLDLDKNQEDINSNIENELNNKKKLDIFEEETLNNENVNIEINKKKLDKDEIIENNMIYQDEENNKEEYEIDDNLKLRIDKILNDNESTLSETTLDTSDDNDSIISNMNINNSNIDSSSFTDTSDDNDSIISNMNIDNSDDESI